GLAYQVYSSPVFYADTGNLAVEAGCQPERLGELVRVLRGVLGEVAANGLTPAEVRRAQGQLRGELVLSLEDTGSRMSRIGKNELHYGRAFTIDETLARIAEVTPEKVAEVADRYLRRVRAAGRGLAAPGGGTGQRAVLCRGRYQRRRGHQRLRRGEAGRGGAAARIAPAGRCPGGAQLRAGCGAVDAVQRDGRPLLRHRRD